MLLLDGGLIGELPVGNVSLAQTIDTLNELIAVVNKLNTNQRQGIITPGSLADTDAAINTIYYSTTASKLVYKDAGGIVHALY